MFLTGWAAGAGARCGGRRRVKGIVASERRVLAHAASQEVAGADLLGVRPEGGERHPGVLAVRGVGPSADELGHGAHACRRCEPRIEGRHLLSDCRPPALRDRWVLYGWRGRRCRWCEWGPRACPMVRSRRAAHRQRRPRRRHQAEARERAVNEQYAGPRHGARRSAAMEPLVRGVSLASTAARSPMTASCRAVPSVAWPVGIQRTRRRASAEVTGKPRAQLSAALPDGRARRRLLGLVPLPPFAALPSRPSGACPRSAGCPPLTRPASATSGRRRVIRRRLPKPVVGTAPSRTTRPQRRTRSVRRTTATGAPRRWIADGTPVFTRSRRAPPMTSRFAHSIRQTITASPATPGASAEDRPTRLAVAGGERVPRLRSHQCSERLVREACAEGDTTP